MIKTKKITEEREVVDDVICNKCGASLLGTCGNINGTGELTVLGGYDSPFFGDRIEYRFALCERCLLVIFNDCQIPPTYTDMDDIYADIPKDIEINQQHLFTKMQSLKPLCDYYHQPTLSAYEEREQLAFDFYEYRTEENEQDIKPHIRCEQIILTPEQEKLLTIDTKLPKNII
jgi:hypothetical protein